MDEKLVCRGRMDVRSQVARAGSECYPSGGAVVVVEPAAQALAPLDPTRASKMARFGVDDPVG